jgi:hypothetical protein
MPVDASKLPTFTNAAVGNKFLAIVPLLTGLLEVFFCRSKKVFNPKKSSADWKKYDGDWRLYH